MLEHPSYLQDPDQCNFYVFKSEHVTYNPECVSEEM